LDHNNEDDGLNPQDCVFMHLSKAINNLAWNNCHTSPSDDSRVKVCKPDTFDGLSMSYPGFQTYPIVGFMD
jgi:hypothetical protein